MVQCNLTIRKLSGDEVDPTLIAELWNSALASRFRLRPAVISQNVIRCLSPQNHVFHIAFVDNAPAGFVWLSLHQDSTLRHRTQGYLTGIVVAPKYRGRGIGITLYDRAEECARQQGTRVLHTGGGDCHLLPGIPSLSGELKKLLEKRGFGFHRVFYDLDIDLSHLRMPVPQTTLKRSGHTTVELLEHHFGDEMDVSSDLLEFTRRTFPGRWFRETVELVRARDPLHATLIVRAPEGLLGFCHVYQAGPGLTRIPPSLYWAPIEPSEGGLGPIGIAKNARGQGVGTMLLYESLYYLYGKGVRRVTIDWVARPCFFEAVGSQVRRAYSRGTKFLFPRNSLLASMASRACCRVLQLGECLLRG